ncbi:MAG: hypothetical protein KDD62_06380 [Bdellovibrionales bacterium]|nr:hypothetical protein [Bdellovibrionales bacterium]
MRPPVLLQPSVYAFRNRWVQRDQRFKSIRRDISLLTLSFLVMGFLFLGMHSVLMSVRAAESVLPIHPTVILQIFFMFLFGILSLSSLVSGISALFAAQDMDLLLSSPISSSSLFVSRFMNILKSSAWMLTVFGAPVLVAFGVSYQVPLLFYIKAIAILVPFIAIPVSVAVCITLLVCTFVPVKIARHAMLIGASLALLGVYYFLHATSMTTQGADQTVTVLALFSKLGVVNRDWLPSHWLAHVLGSLLLPLENFLWPHILLLYSSFLASITLSYLVFHYYYLQCYSNAQSKLQHVTLASKRSQKRLQFLLPGLPFPTRALFSKELKLFSRDITQIVQLLLLIGICVMYLYNFKILAPDQDVSESIDLWRKGILMFFNLIMGSFVVIAICTRFVFPSVSLEGKAFWLISVSPLSTKEFLSIKFGIWYFPITCISLVVFISGALAIHVSPMMILFHAFMCVFLCYGMVGAAIGCGALFHQFDFEHQAQLSTSLGSLAYMIIASALVVITMLPSGLLLFLRILRISTESPVSIAWISLIIVCMGLMAYINYLAASWSIALGERALESKKL